MTPFEIIVTVVLVLLVAAVIFLLWWCNSKAAKVVSQHAEVIMDQHTGPGPAGIWPPGGLTFP